MRMRMRMKHNMWCTVQGLIVQTILCEILAILILNCFESSNVCFFYAPILLCSFSLLIVFFFPVVLRNGEMLSLTACSGKSLSTNIFNPNPVPIRENREIESSGNGNGNSSLNSTGNSNTLFPLSNPILKSRSNSKIEISEYENPENTVKQIRWVAPQTENNTNNAAGCFILLLNTNDIIGLSPSGPHGQFARVIFILFCLLFCY